MRGLDYRLARAAMWLGVAGVLAASFALASGPWKAADIKGPPVIVTIVLGLLAIVGARLAMRLLVLFAAVGYLAAALLQLAQFGRPTNWLGGSGSTFALFLGLGVGMLAVALAPTLEPDRPNPDKVTK